MYQAEADPYCYPGTTVLKNKLDIKDQTKLSAFEAEITTQRASEPLPTGKFDYAHYRALHRHLFQDVYPWAGIIRTVRIAKDGNWFCYPEHIDGRWNPSLPAWPRTTISVTWKPLNSPRRQRISWQS